MCDDGLWAACLDPFSAALPICGELAKRNGHLGALLFQKTGPVQIFRFNALSHRSIEYNVGSVRNASSPRVSLEVLMYGTNRFDVTPADSSREQHPKFAQVVNHPVNVVREGRLEPFLNSVPAKSSSPAHWGGVALENHTVPAVFIPRHAHPELFLHLVLKGTVRYEVNTGGRNLRFISCPGMLFLLPSGTVDEVNWTGPTQRVAVAIQTTLLTHALEETAHETELEFTEHWDLMDRHISALLLEMLADLEDNSPVGTIYGESLANALAVYLLRRYALRRIVPVTYKRGLSGNRLKRVLDYIAATLDENVSLAQLAAIAGMSPHYFSELFKLSTGQAPHNYVLMQRIERAKQRLRDPKRSIIDAGLDAGFQNPSHFARMFRKVEGTTPSTYRAEHLPRSIL